MTDPCKTITTRTYIDPEELARLQRIEAAAMEMREAFKGFANAVARRDTAHLAYEMDQAVAAFDAAIQEKQNDE